MAEKGLQIQMIPIVPKGRLGNPAKLFALMHRGITDQAAEGVRFMSFYPPKQKTDRTGTLRRSWSFRVVSGNRRIEGIIGSNPNIAPYNERVQGENQEEPWASIGWRNIKDLIKLIERSFPKRMQDLVGRVFK